MHDRTPPDEPARQRSDTDTAVPTPELQLDLLIDPSINFAAMHNDVPTVKQLTLSNTGQADANDIELRLRIDRSLSSDWSHRVHRLAPGESIILTDIGLPLRAETLAHLTERDSADLHASVFVNDELTREQKWPIDALAFDEWEGLRTLPELLAAFVTPNHPAIERLLGEARLHLERATDDPALSGYQRNDPARVRETAEAIYRAVGDLAIGYINPPASFEQTGQRVRLADQITERRLATCLDLTLFVAGLLEQCGLHPLVVLTRGHAFVGVWLSKERFPEPAVSEPLRLRKRVQLDEILVIETTGLTHTPTMPFDQARDEAIRRLKDPADFHYAVDVKAARAKQIRPLPLRVKPGTYDLIDLERAAQIPLAAPNTASETIAGETINGEQSQDTETTRDGSDDFLDDLAIDLPDTSATSIRLERWKRKLLDLSLRNRVLNHRDTKKSIPLEIPEPAGFEDRFAQGERFTILPKAKHMEGADPRSADVHAERTGEDARLVFLNHEMVDGRLHAQLTERELEKRLVEIYRAARMGLEESGANTLYLAIGFLSWFESPSSTQARLAPIVLLPATLERLPAGRGYRLSRLDEDARINVTLLEKLRTEYDLDIDGLDTLEEDDAGLDIHAILRKFREAVRDIPKWDVIDRVDLGLFSFNKFLMWRDLQDRSKALVSNPVVQRLVDPGGASAMDSPTLPDPSELDEARPPNQTLCPMDADSSQLAAVFAAHDGHSFVLEGPPGTGKSQTITNLIAHALSQGKRVLFVSEKMAALGVVQRRLEKIGLGPFCLELHSNKANKRAVLEQLGEALDLAADDPPEDWQQHAEQIQASRTTLNALVEAMHRQHPIDLSVYEATAELTGLDNVPQLELGIPDPANLTAEQFEAMAEAVHRLANAARAIGAVDEHPYRAAGLTHYTAALPEALRSASTPAEEALQDLADATSAALARLGLDKISPAELSSDAIAWLIKLGELLAEPYHPTPRLLTEAGFAGVYAAVAEQIELGRQRDAERTRLLERYDPRIFNEDLGDLRTNLANGLTALPIISWFKCYGPRKRVKLSLKSGASLPGGAAVLDDLDAMIRVRDWSAGLASEANPGACFAGNAWLKGEAEWDAILALLDWAERFRNHFDTPAANAYIDGEADMQARMISLAIDHRSARSDETTRALIAALRDKSAGLDARLTVLDALMTTDQARAWGADDEAGRIDTVASTLEAWGSDPSLLRDWAHWCAVRGAVIDLGLSPLVDAHAARSVPAGQLGDVLRRSVLSQWHASVTAAEPALAGFHRLDHERQIQRFRELDKQFLSLTALQVRAQLATRLPMHEDDPHDNSEVGVLRRQMKLKRRHMPVRKLIASLPNLLPRLKPCLLMSPLSVAHYLDTQGDSAAGAPFDLIVFDEASQIPVWDAVGALARGKACVVVGDSKQLPPTNFFQKLESDDDVPDENDFVELESILDECSASGLPSMRLLWHYRSRHESLIAFSNTHYYEGRLNTFPSPADESNALGVTLKRIEGVYDRGGTCTNPAEAKALVADVVDRLKQYDTSTYRSIGIVTFSMAQQILIEDLLDQARQDEPGIEVFFGDAVDEPVFVKNLENVQGDERAAIYFSVCYGPDESGKVAMNFGPLNREGGERRLNVAVTRARERVALYSSLRADQIDLSRTQAVGVRHLRAFLDYAERGADAISTRPSTQAHQPPSQISLAIAQSLRQRGYRVDLDIGLSGYRVAVAVRDPDTPDAYLLGIEFDGPYYRNAQAARDRDRTRPAVMRGLGWRLHRVWSLDYMHNAEAELQRIEAAIDRAKRSASDAEPDATAYANQATSRPSRRRKRDDSASIYEPYVPSKPEGDAEAFYNEGKTKRVCRTVLKIAKREAPLHESVLAKRLTLCWQISRLTSKAGGRTKSIIDRCIEDGAIKREGTFIWLAEQDPAAMQSYRVPADGDDAPRDIDEVPPQELQAAALAVLKRMIAMPREDLMRETAELFGLSRLTPRVQPLIDEAVQDLLDAGSCVADTTGQITLP